MLLPLGACTGNALAGTFKWTCIWSNKQAFAFFLVAPCTQFPSRQLRKTLVIKEVVVTKQQKGKQDALCLGLGSVLGIKKACQSFLILRGPFKVQAQGKPKTWRFSTGTWASPWGPSLIVTIHSLLWRLILIMELPCPVDISSPPSVLLSSLIHFSLNCSQLEILFHSWDPA